MTKAFLQQFLAIWREFYTTCRYAHFKPSDPRKIRIEELIQREKTAGLSKEEKAELDLYMQLEHLMRLAKARARESNEK